MSIRLIRYFLFFAIVVLVMAERSHAQSTTLTPEYLMTYRGELAAPYNINDKFMIFNVRAPGGWAKGPKINGVFIPPGGDWMRVLPSGALRLDVRATLQTDDGALIYMSYNGTLQVTPEVMQRLMKGEVLRTEDIPYFITAPTFETSAPKYAWLNTVQAANKIVELKLGDDGYVKYDTFILR